MRSDFARQKATGRDRQARVNTGRNAGVIRFASFPAKLRMDFAYWLGALLSTRAWYLALKRAGLESFRFHQLRHTWASWHIQSGTPLFALQELGGWETERMVRRYAHLAADHLAAYLGNAQIHGTFLAHPPTLPKPLDETILEDQ